MSLLDRAATQVTVYPEVATTDLDGNTINVASDTGYQSGARVSVAERPEELATQLGEVVEVRYHLRLVNHPAVLGAQSQIEWPVGSGHRYSIVGDVRQYRASAKTAHDTYEMVRR
jgi:hypothetical protein